MYTGNRTEIPSFLVSFSMLVRLPRTDRIPMVTGRSVSYDSSLVFEKNLDRLLTMSTPLTKPVGLPTPGRPERNPPSPPGLQHSTPEAASRQPLAKPKSQAKVAISTSTKIQPRKRVPPVADLSPIQGSPPASPAHHAAVAKENCGSNLNPNKNTASKSRRAFGADLSPANNVSAAVSRIPVKRLDEMTSKRRSGLFGDLRRSSSNLAAAKEATAERPVTSGYKASSSVRDRVMEWEREKQRLREMERMDDMDTEREEDEDDERKEAEREKAKEKVDDIRQMEEVEKQVSDNQEEEEGFMVVVKRAKEKKAGTQSKGKGIPKAARGHNKEKVDKENVAPIQPARGSRPLSPPQSPVSPVMSPLTRSES